MDISQAKAEKIEYFLAQAEQYNFTREYNKAMNYYVRAGLLGDINSIREVCRKLKSGYGMPYSGEELYRCMWIGARAGIADAMYELGVCFSSGIGVDRDPVQAMHWFSEGAAAGSEEAKNSLRAYNYDFRIRTYSDATPFPYQVRETVFAKEFCQEEKLDHWDTYARHFVVHDGEKAVATCRVCWDEQRQAFVLSKLAVLKEYRSLGLGRDLMNAAVEYVKEAKGKTLVVQAKVSMMGFFQKFGFDTEQNVDEMEHDDCVELSRGIIG